jgi:hypothetical protein
MGAQLEYLEKSAFFGGLLRGQPFLPASRQLWLACDLLLLLSLYRKGQGMGALQIRQKSIPPRPTLVVTFAKIRMADLTGIEV